MTCTDCGAILNRYHRGVKRCYCCHHKFVVSLIDNGVKDAQFKKLFKQKRATQ